MRVQEGHAEIVFPPLEIEDVGRVAALAIAIERAAHGQPTPPLIQGPRIVRPQWYDAGGAVGACWGAGFLIGLAPVGVILCFIPTLREMDAELACGPGDRIVTVSAGDGASLECDKHPDKWLTLHWLGGLLLGLSIIVLIGLAITAARLRGARRRADTGARGRDSSDLKGTQPVEYQTDLDPSSRQSPDQAPRAEPPLWRTRVSIAVISGALMVSIGMIVAVARWASARRDTCQKAAACCRKVQGPQSSLCHSRPEYSGTNKEWVCRDELRIYREECKSIADGPGDLCQKAAACCRQHDNCAIDDEKTCDGTLEWYRKHRGCTE
jgi:hypothetical protein